MPRTRIDTQQIDNEGIRREDLDVSTTGKAVIRKVIAGTNTTISSTGVDPGTGDVTINSTGPSGTWTQVAKGTTTVSYATETVLATVNPADGEVLLPLLTVRPDASTDFNGEVSLSLAPTDVPGGVLLGGVVYTIVQPTDRTANQEFRVYHKIRLPGNPPTNYNAVFDWAIWKSLP